MLRPVIRRTRAIAALSARGSTLPAQRALAKAARAEGAPTLASSHRLTRPSRAWRKVPTRVPAVEIARLVAAPATGLPRA
jgi:hypothetical protein